MTSGQMRRRRSTLLWTACALAAASALLWGSVPEVVFLGSRAVPMWVPSAFVFGFAVALLVVSGVINRSRRDQAGREVRRQRWYRLRVVTVAGTFTLAGLYVSLGAVFAGEYQIIPPIGPDGCRVVVKEWSFAQSSGGDVWEAGGLRLGRHIGAYSGDDGYRPVQEGTYSLTWDKGVGVLTVWGTESNPVLREGPNPVRVEPFRVKCTR